MLNDSAVLLSDAIAQTWIAVDPLAMHQPQAAPVYPSHKTAAPTTNFASIDPLTEFPAIKSVAKASPFCNPDF